MRQSPTALLTLLLAGGLLAGCGGGSGGTSSSGATTASVCAKIVAADASEAQIGSKPTAANRAKAAAELRDFATKIHTAAGTASVAGLRSAADGLASSLDDYAALVTQDDTSKLEAQEGTLNAAVAKVTAYCPTLNGGG